MGARPLRTLLTVELPLAFPVIMAGVRVATVMAISLVSVASYIGYGGLGQLFTDGFQRNYPTPVVAGVVLSLLLALVADAVLVAIQWLCTPWLRRQPDMIELLKNLGSWLTSGAQWSGPEGIAARVLEHLEYSVLATLAAALIALPVGLLIGHTGRGAFLADQPLLLRPGAAHRRPGHPGVPGRRAEHVAGVCSLVALAVPVSSPIPTRAWPPSTPRSGTRQAAWACAATRSSSRSNSRSRSR